MRRYGDNVTHEDLFEEQPGNGKGENTRLFLGGCAATFGSFPGPVNVPKVEQSPKKRLFVKLLSFLGVEQKKTGEE